MNINRIDLNLLVYLDVLLREGNVTKAAQQLGITQPAMSNSLKRLRELFGDPLLIRTSDGMTATEHAQELRPLVRQILSQAEQLFTPEDVFQPSESRRVFRIMTSDYAEATLVPHIVRLIVGGNYIRLVPLSAIFGGIFLLWADIVARTVMAPEDIPVGIVTGLIGGIAFVLLLKR